MRFPPSFIDEVKARLPVSEVVGRRVKLKRAGREFKGLSPFQQEKTPSFTVNDQKQFYHDFSTGKHGNIFDFVMETEGVSFPEAVERLAAMAGLPLPRNSREDEQREQRQKSLFEVMELATQYFEQNLASRVGAQARGYLSDRAIAPSSIVEFRIGYAAADRFALKEYLGSKGVPVADMIEAGLLIAGDDIPVPYDRFRDRVMIPIHDQRGRVVGFGGRALRQDVQPKYLNSPETSIFHKGSMVFNFHRARQPAHEANSVVAVEGYMDAIAVSQAGIKAVVATMGTAFTEEQIATLWRLSPEPVVCFDSDRAGIAAAYRSVDRILPLLRVGKTFRFVFMDEQKDPDDLIREKGVEAFRSVLSGSLPLWDVLWQRETVGQDVRTPDRQAALEQKLYALVRTIQDPAVNTAFFRTSRTQLANLFWRANRKLARKSRDAGSPLNSHVKFDGEGQRSGLQKLVLGMLLEYPVLLENRRDAVARLQFPGDLELFLTRLFQFETDLSVSAIWEQIDSEFPETLQEVHGAAGDGKQRGHRLFERFPILGRAPPPDFVSGCLDHFIKVLHWHELEDDIQRIEPEAGQGEESAIARLLNLVRERHAAQQGISLEVAALSDWAAAVGRGDRTAAAAEAAE